VQKYEKNKNKKIPVNYYLKRDETDRTGTPGDYRRETLSNYELCIMSHEL
jgi:hypothetical protein